jgi:hypothetical protein
MPGILLFTGPGRYFAHKNLTILFYTFVLLGNVYTAAIIILWCIGVLVFFVERATEGTLIPLLIWSYGVALGPWQYMAQKENQSGSGEGSLMTTLFAQIGYVLVLILASLTSITFVGAVVVFAIIMLVGVTFQFALAVIARQADSSMLSSV